MEAGAFQSSAIREVQIPRLVEVISTSCFEGCGQLSTLIIEQSQLKTIEDHAFCDTQVQCPLFPATIDSVGFNPFGRKLSASPVLPESDLPSFVIGVVQAQPIRFDYIMYSLSVNCEIFGHAIKRSDSRDSIRTVLTLQDSFVRLTLKYVSLSSFAGCDALLLVYDRGDRRGFTDFRRTVSGIAAAAQTAGVYVGLIGALQAGMFKAEIRGDEGQQLKEAHGLSFYTEIGGSMSTSFLAPILLVISELQERACAEDRTK
jgi:hypothetical protein